MKKLLYIPQWIKVLPKIDEGYTGHKITTMLGMCYANVHKIIQELKMYNYIEDCGKKGRISILRITKKGKELAKNCREICRLHDA